MWRGAQEFILDRAGLGQYFWGQHELLLFGVKGKGMDPSVYKPKKSVLLWSRKYIRTVVLAPRQPKPGSAKVQHSRKPDEEQFEIIETRSEGPYLEMFARRRRDGWTSWGKGL